MAGARLVVVAVQPFQYRGETVATGEICLVRAIEAAALVYQRRARWVQGDEARGVYQRRDLVAEAPAVRVGARRRREKRGA
jgi:hypothetical protein